MIIGKWNLGRKQNIEERKMRSRAQLKRWKNTTKRKRDKIRKAMSLARIGMKFSKEHCKNISKNHNSWNKGLTKDNSMRVKNNGNRIKKALNKIEYKKCRKNVFCGKNNPMYGRSPWNKGENKNNNETLRKASIKQRISTINYIKKSKGQISPRYNRKSCQFFDEINHRFCLNGFHAENVGELYLKDLGYFLDYYEPTLNLVIEWNEKRHYNSDGSFKQRHIDRQKEIQNHLHCTFINIDERNFEFKKELIMNRIKEIALKTSST